MKRGEVTDWHDGERWVRIRVLVPLGGVGVGSVIFSFRRLEDGQRVLLFRDGTETEVPG